MRAFADLPVAAQNTLCFWALALCFAAIANTGLLQRQRRWRPGCAAAAGLVCAYLLMNLIHSLSELRLHGERAAAAIAFGRLPWALPLCALALLTLLNALLYRSCRSWRKRHITPASIKESLDGLPAGLCYYLEEGRCILVNHRMNDICVMLLGRSLQNGALLAETALAQSVHRLPDGTTVSFRSRTLEFEGQPLHELIADDITELYARTQQLRQDNARAEQLRAGMHAYGETIADTVRRQEILQAKIDIHDRMNRMLLSTQRAAQPDASAAERAEILRLWQNQTALLGSGTERPRGSSLVTDLNALAAFIGIELVWDGTPDAHERALSLFLMAAREAMINAAKHGRAAQMRIALRGTPEALYARFTNDGAPPSGEIAETGGLALLRQSLEAAGGGMQVEAAEGFCLSVTIPKGGKQNAVSGPDR